MMARRRPFEKRKIALGCLVVWICASGIGVAVMVDGLAVFYRAFAIRLAR